MVNCDVEVVDGVFTFTVRNTTRKYVKCYKFDHIDQAMEFLAGYVNEKYGTTNFAKLAAYEFNRIPMSHV